MRPQQMFFAVGLALSALSLGACGQLPAAPSPAPTLPSGADTARAERPGAITRPAVRVSRDEWRARHAGSGPLSAQDAAMYQQLQRADWLAGRPELADPDSQAIIDELWQDPDFLAAAEEPYWQQESPVQPVAGTPGFEAMRIPDCIVDPETGELCPQPEPPTNPWPSVPDTLGYIKSVAWGDVNNYNAQYDRRWTVNTTHPGLDWERDGCSVPGILGLGYRRAFEPACNVHDFGYRNIPPREKTLGNKFRTDLAFRDNMRRICASKPWYQRPPCYVASGWYDSGVTTFGFFYWY